MKYGGIDYIDLIPNLEDNLDNFNKCILQKKQQIFNIHKQTIQREKNKKIKELTNNNVLYNDACSLLDGSAFKELNNLTNPGKPQCLNLNITQKDFFGFNSNAIVENISKEYKNIDNFCNIMKEKVINYLYSTSPNKKGGEIEKIYEDIFLTVIKNFESGPGSGNRKTKIKQHGNDIYQAIISTVLNKENKSFYANTYKKDCGLEINSFVVRMISLIESLRLTNGKISNVSSKKSNADTSEVIKSICQSWFDLLNNLTAESAIVDADYLLSNEFGTVLNRVHHEMALTGNKKVDVHFSIDKDMQELLSIGSGKKQPQFNSFNNTVSNSDVSFYLKKDGNDYIGQIGFSVKNGLYDFDNLMSDTFSFNAVKQTPLMTLMIKEAKLSKLDMNNVYKILAGHPPTFFINSKDRTGYSIDTLNNYWENIKEYVIYAGVLNTISNLGYEKNKNDKVFYMVLGGALFTIEDIINVIENQIINSQNKNTINLFYERTHEQGLDRDTYMKKNEKIYLRNRSQEEMASIRGNLIVRHNINTILYKTKIKIELNLNKTLLNQVRI